MPKTRNHFCRMSYDRMSYGLASGRIIEAPIHLVETREDCRP